MSGRSCIGRAAIIGAAIDLIREGGWEKVTARSLAVRLEASTMPIYSAIGSMEDLRKEVAAEGWRRLDAAQRSRRTENEVLDLAFGFVAFARDEPGLFRFLMAGQAHMDSAISEMAQTPEYEAGLGGAANPVHEIFHELDKSGQRSDFVLRSWIFAYGLAELVAGGQVEMNDAEIVRHLEAAGGAFYLYGKAK